MQDKIGFLTARKGEEGSDGSIVRKYFEENKYLASDTAGFGFWDKFYNTLPLFIRKVHRP